MPNDDREMSAGAMAFKIYLDQLRQLCPDLLDEQRVHAAAMLAGAETLAQLLGVIFHQPMRIDPRALLRTQ